MSVRIPEISNVCKKLIDEVGTVVVGEQTMLKYVIILRQ